MHFSSEFVTFALCNVYLNVDHTADISKAMQAKRKRLEAFTKSSLKGSNQKIEQLWKTQHSQRYMCTTLAILNRI